ncbi:MAG: hypothetical protein GX442_26760 [Candidatus Riflebacteria bacterium]|nr:hypothetical protein [Candidatus Riflebacteria bacterium]
MRRVLLGVLAVVFLAGLAVPALAEQGGPKDGRTGGEKPGVGAKALKPSVPVTVSAKKYQAYRQKLNQVMDTFRNIHSAYGTGASEGTAASAFMQEEKYLPVVMTQLWVIKAFLAGQNDKGHGDMDYWIRTHNLLAAQGRFAATKLRDMIQSYQGKVNPLLGAAIANVADNLGKGMDKYSNGYGDLDYWVGASGYVRDALWQGASNLQAIIDAVPFTLPVDVTPIVKGQLMIIQDLVINQGDKGNGNIDYWIRSHGLLAMQARIIAGILQDILGRHPGLMGLLATSIRNVAGNLGQAAAKYSNGYGDLDYWVAASGFVRDALRAAGRNLKDITDSL